MEKQEEAKKIRKNLNKGHKFEDLVTKHSKDKGSKANGGEIGYLQKGQTVPEFESKAFSMKTGEISDPVKSQFGWHIIKVLDSRDVKIPSKKDIEETIRAKLSNEQVGKYIQELTEKANITIKI